MQSDKKHVSFHAYPIYKTIHQSLYYFIAADKDRWAFISRFRNTCVHQNGSMSCVTQRGGSACTGDWRGALRQDGAREHVTSYLNLSKFVFLLFTIVAAAPAASASWFVLYFSGSPPLIMYKRSILHFTWQSFALSFMMHVGQVFRAITSLCVHAYILERAWHDRNSSCVPVHLLLRLCRLYCIVFVFFCVCLIPEPGVGSLWNEFLSFANTTIVYITPIMVLQLGLSHWRSPLHPIFQSCNAFSQSHHRSRCPGMLKYF